MAYTEQDLRNIIRKNAAYSSFDGKILTRIIGIDTDRGTVTLGDGKRIDAEEFFLTYYEL